MKPTFAVAALAALLLAGSARAAEEKEKYPNLTEAKEAIAKAEQSIKAAQKAHAHKMGGHGDAALKALKAADHHVDQAIATLDKGKGGKPAKKE